MDPVVEAPYVPLQASLTLISQGRPVKRLRTKGTDWKALVEAVLVDLDKPHTSGAMVPD